MQLTKIKVEDLKPARSPFTLAAHKDTTFHLKPFSLATRRWVLAHYGSVENLNERFKLREVLEVVDLIWHLLEEKSFFNDSLDEFLEAVQTTDDQVNILNAVTISIGVSQTQANELYKFAQEQAKKAAAQPKKRSK